MTGICRIIAAATLVLMAGCGPKRRLNGTYIGSRAIQVAPKTDSVVAAQLARVKLIVKPDGTAYLSDGGVPVDGHIEYGFDAATFVPESIDNVSIDRQPPEEAKRFTIELKPVGPADWLYDGTDGTVELKPI